MNAEAGGPRLTRELMTASFVGGNGRRVRSIAERLAGRFRPAGDCLEWQGARMRQGYGAIAAGALLNPGRNKVIYVHRAVLAIVRGWLDADEMALHDCDNPPCASPDHLYVGNQKQNVADALARGRR